MPLLGDPIHAKLTSFLQSVPSRLISEKPRAIICVTAHWENHSSDSSPALSTAARPTMLYDYGGFPSESYHIQYPAPGPDASMVNRIAEALSVAGIGLDKDAKRGFDHGTFVPLKLMYPEADVPVLQLSILSSMDPVKHWEIGKALSPLRSEGYLIVGSGFTFHNIRSMMSLIMDSNSSSTCTDRTEAEKHSTSFNEWIVEACKLTGEDRKARLKEWASAPSARHAHPREEHLVPLFVVAGAGEEAGVVCHEFNMGEEKLGKGRGIKASSFIFN
jgi:4,5-DOPA dioxygenase extradiol